MATLRAGHATPRDPAIARRLVQVTLGLATYLGVLFASAGSLAWTWGWAYASVLLAQIAIGAALLPASVIAERGRKKENVEPWDRVLTRVSVAPYFGVPVVAGLDARFGWSPATSPAVHLVALAIFALGQVLFTWAMLSNRFFSNAVRIQRERGHTVETGGPYRWVRHPGYAATIVSQPATAIALGSRWALVPALVLAVLFVIRTALEDRTLRAKLPGYEAYATRVRHRLLPGVW